MDQEDLLVILCNLMFAYSDLIKLYGLLKRQREQTRTRRWWVRPHNRASLRQKYGAFNQLFNYFKTNDHEEFFKFTRMSVDQFTFLHNLVKVRLEKHSRREPLSSEIRLAATLCYLAHGDSIATTSWLFRIGKSTLYKIIPEVCNVLWEILQPKYLRVPEQNDWLKIAEEFQQKWDYPNCLGAIDGKHCRIWSPPLSGSTFHNYKGYFSFVLLATCDANYRFTWVDIGDYGSLNDAGIWANSTLGKALKNGTLDLPPQRTLPNSDITLPLSFVGDEAFPLTSYLMRPYARRNLLGAEQKVFNYRLSRARRVIENAFGILTARWAILQTSIRLKLETAEAIVQATVCLHNFLISNELEQSQQHRHYLDGNLVDQEGTNGEVMNGEWRNNIQEGVLNRLGRIGANAGAAQAMRQRDTLAHYFVSEAGEMPWQWNHI